MKTLKFGREQIKDEDSCYRQVWVDVENEAEWEMEMPRDSVTPCSYVPKNLESNENQHFLQSDWFSLHHGVCEKAKK